MPAWSDLSGTRAHWQNQIGPGWFHPRAVEAENADARVDSRAAARPRRCTSARIPDIHSVVALTRAATRVALRRRIETGDRRRGEAHGEMRPFIAFICKQSGAGFRVSFADFPDCASSGRTVAEAQKNAERALALQCWKLHHAGAPVPQPSFMHEIDATHTRTEGLVALIAPPNMRS